MHVCRDAFACDKLGGQSASNSLTLVAPPHESQRVQRVDRNVSNSLDIRRLRIDDNWKRLVLVEHAACGGEHVRALELRCELRRRDLELGKLGRLDLTDRCSDAPSLEIDVTDTFHASEGGSHDQLGELAHVPGIGVSAMRCAEVGPVTSSKKKTLTATRIATRHGCSRDQVCRHRIRGGVIDRSHVRVACELHRFAPREDDPYCAPAAGRLRAAFR